VTPQVRGINCNAISMTTVDRPPQDGSLGLSRWYGSMIRVSCNANRSRPIQAALASAASFASGAALPLLVTAIAPAANLIPFIAGTSMVFLAILGGLAARAGGAGVLTGATRVTAWGVLAMAITAGIGALFGTST
jgi:VIT1/CCC1 family predicted Fe2+/Mn2+ transporter